MPILEWLNKKEALKTVDKVPYRLLKVNYALSYGEQSKNMLIKGNNLEALKALLPYYKGQVKCIYINPPYNTGSRFTTDGVKLQYDDNLEHSEWLTTMYPRIEILRELLEEKGSIWISIDDDESHYLKVICDEIFGRKNFVANIIWHKKHTRANDAKWFSDNHDHILCYAKNKEIWERNLIPRTDNDAKGYTNPDDDPRGVWASGPCHVKTPSEKDIYEIETLTGRKIMPPAGTSWRFSKEKLKALMEDNRIYFGTTGNNVPRYKRFLTDVQDGIVPVTIWVRDEVGDNQEAKTEVKQFNPVDVFTTPKPERLTRQIPFSTIKQEIQLSYTRQLLENLVETRDMSLNDLLRTKFILKEAIKEKIQDNLCDAEKKGIQKTLFGTSAQIKTDFTFAIDFKNKHYVPEKLETKTRFNKHYFHNVGQLDSEEERNCARAIDCLDQTNYWVRNIPRHAYSFYLQMANGRFYPDFIVQLNDGRLLVIEYKGEHLATNEDTKEKEAIGKLWEKASNGKCFFLTALKNDEQGRYVWEQIRAKIGVD